MQIPDISMVIEHVKRAAKTELLPRFERISAQLKADGSFITEADVAMQAALCKAFEQDWPDIGFLGEEMPEAEQETLLVMSDKPIWIVDPIDGTSNFSLGIPYFAVSVALLYEKRLILGVVYDPCRDECFCATHDSGAFLNQSPLNLSSVSHIDKMTIGLVDYKRLSPTLATKLASQPPFKSQRSFGSVALDWCWMAAGRGDVYLHGKQKLWDYAAGYLVLKQAGGYESTLGGESVFNGVLTPRSAVAAINQPMFEQWFDYLTQAAQ